MDEHTLPVTAPESGEASPDNRRQAARRIEDRHKIERISVRSLLAILLGSLGIALGLSVLWLQYRLDKRIEALHPQQIQIENDIARLRAELATSNARAGTNARRLEELDRLGPRVAELTDSLDELRKRMQVGQRPWILAEARYLLQIANRRLTLERDAKSALAALEAADERLRTLRDPGLNGVHRTLATEIHSLRAFHQPDLAGIAARLAVAEQLAATLPVLGAIADHYRPGNTEEGSAPGFARAWQLLRSSITNMISIRRIGKDAVELVSLEEQGVRRHHLQLLLFSTRLAAARGDEALFRTSIGNARAWLAQMFDPRDPAVASLSGELQELASANIEPALPDISASLRMLDRLAPSVEAAQ